MENTKAPATLLERYGRAILQMEQWKWADTIGPKPDGFDDLPIEQRVEIIKPYLEEAREIVGPVVGQHRTGKRLRQICNPSVTLHTVGVSAIHQDASKHFDISAVEISGKRVGCNRSHFGRCPNIVFRHAFTSFLQR